MKRSASATLISMIMVGVCACAGVELGPAGSEVHVISAEQAVGCEYLGDISVATVATLGIFDRYQKSIREELRALARTSAYQMGGDSLVPIGDMVDGRRRYGVYRCLSK